MPNKNAITMTPIVEFSRPAVRSTTRVTVLDEGKEIWTGEIPVPWIIFSKALQNHDIEVGQEMYDEGYADGRNSRAQMMGPQPTGGVILGTGGNIPTNAELRRQIEQARAEQIAKETQQQQAENPRLVEDENGNRQWIQGGK